MTTLVLVYPNFAIPLRLIGIKVVELFRPLRPTVQASFIMFLGLVFINVLVKELLSETLFLGIAVFWGGAIYLVSSWMLNKAVCKELLSLLKGHV
jgi:hypothetical protein